MEKATRFPMKLGLQTQSPEAAERAKLLHVM